MNIITPLLLLYSLVGNLPTHNLASDLSSDHASYDGEELTLEGTVKVDHDLGHMQAGIATLSKSTDEPEPFFSNLHLEQEVFFLFQNHAELYCDEATVDFQELKGTFSSSSSPVLYRDFIEEKERILELVGREIDFKLRQIENEEEILSCEFASLLAKDDVQIDYAGSFHLLAERALYTNHPVQKGTIEAFSLSPTTLCHLTHGGDEVDAERILIDLEKSWLKMERPKGCVSSLFFPNHLERRCHFSSKNLHWDHACELLTLQEDIDVQDEYLGHLQGEETLVVSQTQRFGKTVIQWIEATGKTKLESTATSLEEGHKLTSFGSLKLDRDDLLLFVKSPVVDGCTPLDKQLIYEKDDLTLYADEAVLEYSLRGLELEPNAVNLKGHVRIAAQKGCGIADYVHYYPNRSQIRLQAKPGNQVLFWHEKQNLKLSAQEILILIDKATKQETIKGVGAVRFAFNEEEDELLERLFPEYQSQK